MKNDKHTHTHTHNVDLGGKEERKEPLGNRNILHTTLAVLDVQERKKQTTG